MCFRKGLTMVSSLIAWSLHLLKIQLILQKFDLSAVFKRAHGQCLVGGKCKEFSFCGIHPFKVTSLVVPNLVLGLPFYCNESER